jgi:hypothetical protein
LDLDIEVEVKSQPELLVVPTVASAFLLVSRY